MGMHRLAPSGADLGEEPRNKLLAIKEASSHIGPCTNHAIFLLVPLALGLEFSTGCFAQVTMTAEGGHPAVP